MFQSYPITLDGLTMAWGGITEFYDDDSNSIVCMKLDGWQGAPARRLVQTDRPGADGAFDGDAYRGVRTIGVEGRFFAQTEVGRTVLERRITAICADPTRYYAFTVADAVNPLTAYVRLAGEVKAVPTSKIRGELSLSLTAPNPLRQGAWTTSLAPTGSLGTGGIAAGSAAVTTGIVSTEPGIASGTPDILPAVTVTNTGSAPAILVAEFVGGTDPALVRLSDGSTVSINTTLAPSDSLFLNLSPHYAHDVPGQAAGTFMYGRSVYGPGGYAGAGGVTVYNGSWPVLNPGEQQQFLFTGGGFGKVHVRPMYW